MITTLNSNGSGAVIKIGSVLLIKTHRTTVVRNLTQRELTTSQSIRYFLPAMLTGLLQTPEYAYASCSALGGSDPAATSAMKIDRQKALSNDRTHFRFLIMPAALTFPLVLAEHMARQRHRLIELSHRPNITIQVVYTNRSVVSEAPMNTFTIYDHRVVTAELFSGTVTLTDDADIVYHHRLFDYFLSISRSEEETRERATEL